MEWYSRQLKRGQLPGLPFVISQNSFLVSWTATDGANEAGILCYDVPYRFNQESWTLWQNCTTVTSAIFVAAIKL